MEDLNAPLKKIAKGTGLVFIGTILGTLLALIFRIIIVRYITPTEYGLFSLTLVLVNIVVTISILGFENSIPRYVSFALSKKEFPLVRATIKFSIKIALLLSVFFLVLLFGLASNVSNFFQKPSLIMPIRIFVFLIPVLVLTNLLISILRGLEDVRARVYFHSIVTWIFKIFLLTFVIVLSLSFRAVLYSYLIACIFTLFFLIFYARKKIADKIPLIYHPCQFNAREFIAFSLPLLGSGISIMIMQWTDTFMLGYFKTAYIVGLYNAALPLSRFIGVPLSAMVFIYLPVVSQLYAGQRFEEMKKLYVVVTKWTFFITLPLILCMLFASQEILYLFFGDKYISASLALQLLAIGEFFHTFLGPNAMTLISLGKTKIILFCTLISASSNIFLNLLLIPKYGIGGAAAASAFSLALCNILISSFLFKFYVIHPFSKKYLKPVSLAFIFSLTLLKLNSLTINFHIFIILIIISLLSLASIFFTKSIDKEDIWLFESLEKKLFKRDKISRKMAGWLG